MDAHRLKKLPPFDHLSRRERSQVARWADEVEIDAGTELVSEGAFAHEFFVIEEGNAEVTRDGQHVADLGPGDFFGEIALMESDHHRTATVTALSPMRLVVMFQQEFGTMASEIPEVAETLHRAIKDRLAELLRSS
ncbi:MAG TPA: cyclic nucleotide-binding domain-containing protein [Acidimicrobiia bacterium]|jgi:CRP-like cAMP-binding protein|nr:cyclic nucleotide-binding domain-containing protein [Acidimicrobiia bacterium]